MAKIEIDETQRDHLDRVLKICVCDCGRREELNGHCFDWECEGCGQPFNAFGQELATDEDAQDRAEYHESDY